MKALVGFAGFGGVEIVLREFGFEVVSIEIDAAIAEVNRINGGNVITADLLDVDPADYVGWWLFHFSPPCPRFSLARNSKAVQSLLGQILDLARHQRVVNGETEQDLALARKICEFIRVGRPEYFTLENVWGYRKSLSWHLIQYTLLEEGYGVDAWHLNAADYGGVPQSRRRMIVIGRRDGRPPAKPFPTHSKNGDMFTNPWCGWYSAIEDLIPTLKETQLAPWQRDRWPDELRTFLIMSANKNRNGFDNKPGRGFLRTDQPSNTVVASSNKDMPKAFMISNNSYGDGPLVTRAVEKPSFTVVSSIGGKGAMPRAFLMPVQGENSRPLGTDVPAPADTVTANNNQTGIKVIIVGGQFQFQQNGGRRVVQNKREGEPIWTICASDRLDTKIVHPGKVVSINVRCLARFQDFPNRFILPGESGLSENIILRDDPRTDRELACLGIGNALPPGLYRAVLRTLI